MAPRVAIVGGGPVGIIALKKFIEDGFDVTLFEGRNWIGGLWKPDADDGLSALESTHFNSSKYRSAITDFPFPEDVDDFPTAPQLYRYFNDYADRFGLRQYIRLGVKVTAIDRTDDEQWALSIHKDGKPQSPIHFDKVAFATGAFTQAKWPHIEGIELFAGPQDHSIKFHDPAKYKGQNVLIVGLHASTQDTVAALAGHAKKVYVSHRSGLTLLPRYAADGSVYDRMPPLWFMLVSFYMSAWFPTFWTWVFDNLLKSMSKKSYPNQPASWGLSPAPSLAVTTPLIATAIMPHLESGFCEPVPAVAKVTGPRTVRLTDARTLTDIDAIIYCTGYYTSIRVTFPPGLDPYPTLGDSSTWYRNIFPMHPSPDIRCSLALLGHNAIALPGFAQFEVQISAISQIWQGKQSLPSLADMRTFHAANLARRAAIAKRYNAQSTFYPAIDPTTEYAVWLDRTAGLGLKKHFGLGDRWVNLCAWKLWWQERELWRLCLSGVPTPSIYALFDDGGRKAWKGAREQIRKDNEAVKRQAEGRAKALAKDGKEE